MEGFPASIRGDIFSASNQGNLSLVKALIEEDQIPVDAVDDKGNTALHWASFRKHIEIVKYLIEKKCRIDMCNSTHQQSPLHWASVGGDTDVVYLLLEAGADLFLKDSSGFTPLHLAAQNDNVILAAYLLCRGAPVDITDNEGHTPLQWAAYQGHESMCRFLLRHNANLHWKDNVGMTALHWSAVRNQTSICAFLVEEGIHMYEKDKDGATAEVLATQKKECKRTAKFLKEAAKYPSQFKKGRDTLWFLLPALLVFWLFICLVNLPIWATALVFPSSLAALRKLMRPVWPEKQFKSPFWAGWYFFSLVLSGGVYFTRIISVTGGLVLETLFFILVNLGFLYLFFKLYYSDPGFMTQNTVSLQTIAHAVEHQLPRPPVCSTCMAFKPLRSKHCAQCDRCVIRMDHHCTWLNNCVGVSNHHPFILLVIMIVIMHWMFIRFCLLYLAEPTDSPGLGSIFSLLSYGFEKERLITYLAIYHGLNSIWELGVLFSQAMGIARNLTTNEAMNFDRYVYLKDINGHFYNPFHRGFLDNVRDFLSMRKDYWANRFTL